MTDFVFIREFFGDENFFCFFPHFWYNVGMFTKNTKYNFSVIVEQDEDGFVASCPELQGCYSQGETYEEVMENIKDAISLNLEELRAEKQEIPAGHLISLSMVSVMA